MFNICLDLDMQSETMAQRLRRLREAKKLTQEQLGALAGITGQTVHRIESPKRDTQQVLPDTRDRLARALGVSPLYLESGVEAISRDSWPALDVYLREARGLTDEQVREIEARVLIFEMDNRTRAIWEGVPNDDGFIADATARLRRYLFDKQGIVASDDEVREILLDDGGPQAEYAARQEEELLNIPGEQQAADRETPPPPESDEPA